MSSQVTVTNVLQSPQLQSELIKFLVSKKYLGDGLRASYGHEMFKSFSWFVVLDETGVQGVACAGRVAGVDMFQSCMLCSRTEFAVPLLEALQGAQENPWNSTVCFATPRECIVAMEPTFHHHQKLTSGLWLCSLYVLPADTVLPKAAVGDTVLDGGGSITWLEEGDTMIINDNWPHRTSQSHAMVRALLRSNPGVGIRTADGKLICWLLTYHYGSIGMLHTMEEYRRKGLARLVVGALCEHLRRVRPDIAPFCHIINGNVASETLFTSLGFTVAGTADWALFADTPLSESHDVS